MPEGHSIHRLAIAHRRLLAGQSVEVTSPQGRFAADAELVTGRILEDTSAYGKHLFHHYAGDRIVHVHLGLYGKFATGPLPVPEPVGLIRMRLAGEHGWLELRGPTACEVLDPYGVARIHARLGPDPLRDDADPAPAYARITRSDAALLALIMDQSVLAGPGLIYATEVLFRAGLVPTTPGRALSAAAFTEIWEDLRALMKDGVAQGRIDTVHVAHTPEAMRRAPRVDRHGGEVYVYRRAGQPCLVCGTPVRKGTLANRNTYWCPVCQK
ncbi:endonuclease-8 [Catenuloplanes nepalensis]|uniref:DNA-(apurinic or apyrimidinic site) lyase n=1 Tax=Catenuloplanes nepalensis TaxID=587533 RepID=A0ABT9N1F3_9ACTN|nr:DNA-formamidopyrimidine glycosylase family protein [Catenuloplanes nepalensis]MDP9797529.1 endonuclease-8 [Catenuloplanes nepalensis]